MKEYFVIQRVTDNAFWSESYQEFKGWLYATVYSTNASAYTAMMNMKSNIPCKITKIYQNG